MSLFSQETITYPAGLIPEREEELQKALSSLINKAKNVNSVTASSSKGVGVSFRVNGETPLHQFVVEYRQSEKTLQFWAEAREACFPESVKAVLRCWFPNAALKREHRERMRDCFYELKEVDLQRLIQINRMFA